MAPDDSGSGRRFRQEALASLREAARSCTRCPLYKLGTQTVFGEGPENASVMMVGEQPGDAEDLAGKPFVGPAGKLLDRAMEAAGIDRSRVYVTNAVKHFKWVARGKRRLHAKPNAGEVRACKLWLASEVELVQPRILVCLGATAAQAVFGPAFRVTRQGGAFLASPFADLTLATIHPSSILRAPDEAARHAAMAQLTKDLSTVAKRLKRAG
jgi:uracil-DNA glycosylase family protein